MATDSLNSTSVTVDEALADAGARYVLGISGGKDSAALAIHLRDRVPDLQYFFTDTGAELPETYEYLSSLEAVLGKRIARLNAERGFDHWLQVYGGALPSPQMPWCTKQLKIKPLEAWLGDTETYTYIGIRADENRSGYIDIKPTIRPVFPFKEGGITKEQVFTFWMMPVSACPATTSGGPVAGAPSASSSARRSGSGSQSIILNSSTRQSPTRRSGASRAPPVHLVAAEILREMLNRADEIKEKHAAAMERAASRRANLPPST